MAPPSELNVMSENRYNFVAGISRGMKVSKFKAAVGGAGISIPG